MTECEGCTAIPEAERSTERFREQYPFCPGHPTVQGCHGFYAGCNCLACEARDAKEALAASAAQERAREVWN